MLSHKRLIFAKSYHDKVSITNHNNVFYIYYLGRYNNIPMYHYGETNDIYTSEYKLKKTLPYYKKIKCIPVEDNINGIIKFKKFIEKNKIVFTLDEDLDVFTTIDDFNIDDILTFSDKIYSTQS
jgi:hypothetical protein